MNDNAKKLVATLRSGEYQQTGSILTRLDENNNIVGCCCMGVACEMFNQENPDILDIVNDHSDDGGYLAQRRYNDEGSLPPVAVMKWLGLKNRNGYFGPNGGRSLTGTNDSGASFTTIADLIEMHEAELFHEEGQLD